MRAETQLVSGRQTFGKWSGLDLCVYLIFAPATRALAELARPRKLAGVAEAVDAVAAEACQCDDLGQPEHSRGRHGSRSSLIQHTAVGCKRRVSVGPPH